MSAQTLTIAYSQNALYAINAGAWYPEPVTGYEYSTIEIDIDQDALPTWNTAVFTRCVPHTDPASVMIEFELTETATGKTHCLMLRRDAILAYRSFMTLI